MQSNLVVLIKSLLERNNNNKCILVGSNFQKGKKMMEVQFKSKGKSMENAKVHDPIPRADPTNDMSIIKFHLI
jgi:hypothetical protein